MEKLNKIVGKSYLYNASEITIENYKINEASGIVEIFTNKGVFAKRLIELQSFINDLLPVSNKKPELGIALKVDTVTIGSLKDILMDNINKVREDAAYIPQSEEINKNVKSIIDLAKTELEIIKTIRGL